LQGICTENGKQWQQQQQKQLAPKSGKKGPQSIVGWLGWFGLCVFKPKEEAKPRQTHFQQLGEILKPTECQAIYWPTAWANFQAWLAQMLRTKI